jgi:hypothetical protein
MRCGAFLVASVLVLLAGCGTDTADEAQTPRPVTTTESAKASTSEDVSAAIYMPVSHDPGCLNTASLNYCFAVAPTLLPVGNMPLRKVTWQQWGGEEAVGRGELLTRECIPSCVEGRSWYRDVTVTVSDPITCDGVRTYSRMRIDGERALLPLALPLRCSS